MRIKKVIGGVHFAWAPFLYYELLRSENKDIVCIVENNRDIFYAKSLIQTISDDVNVLALPEYESSTDEKTPFDTNIAATRAACLFKMLAAKLSPKANKIILATEKSFSYAPPPVSYFKEIYALRKTQSLSMNELQQILMHFGYKRFELTEKPGQFSIRGGLIDVYPVAEDFPCRIDFFGNSVESIKIFDVNSQKSISEIKEINITKAWEIPISAETKIIFRKKCKNCDKRTLELLDEYGIFNGIERFLQYFFEEDLGSVYDYLETNSLFVSDSASDFDAPNNFPQIYTQKFDGEGENFAVFNNFTVNIHTEKGFQSFLNNCLQYKKSIICVESAGAVNIIKNVFQENNFTDFEISNKISEAQDGITVIHANIREGFILPSRHTIIYTGKQLLGYILQSPGKKKSTSGFFKNHSNLIPGHYVVHKNHGIAIFDGLHTIKVSDVTHDFLCLIYKNNDKLFVPVENIDLISRYGDNDCQVELDKLGGASWNNRSEKVRRKLLVIANSLLEIAAKRKLEHIDPIEINDEKYERFCKKFLHLETADQNAAINEVINDLRGTTPMDRLICGDVGFGKTEVALRAAFIMADAGKQVVLLAPTTILVNQHYKNFMKRFNETGLKVCQLSRFLSKNELQNNIAKIKNGKVQIIIATHTILSSKIQFKNLGLLIIDEEQHFGVKQKEFIKSVKNNIHILAMSATPIPRTLQMAISGIKDISIIASPPMDKLPVKTYVSDFENDTLEKAITREMKRGGQIFIVSPRVEFLDELYSKFTTMFPKINIKVVHGKTPDLEEVINDFCNHKMDILISTNIIDSGIDIQNANTIIVYRAEMFGLSQLYQLRGRVGRLSNVQGYCYLLIPAKKKLTLNAEKRISVLQSLNTLSSGFTLAAYDLDIRGAGNIVGDEQSGHIRDVGVELYQKMLEAAIMMKDMNNEISPHINIGVPVLIPDSYIEDKNLRTSMYRRIGDITTLSEIDEMEFELANRFGCIPAEVYNLLDVIKIKILCIGANIDKIDVGRNGIVFSFHNNECRYPDKLLRFVNKNQNFIKIRPDQKVIVRKKWNNVKERTKDTMKIIGILSRFNTPVSA